MTKSRYWRKFSQRVEKIDIKDDVSYCKCEAQSKRNTPRGEIIRNIFMTIISIRLDNTQRH